MRVECDPTAFGHATEHAYVVAHRPAQHARPSPHHEVRFPGVEADQPPRYSSYKVVGDLVGAVLLSFLAAPAIIISMLLVKLTSRGPVIYTQTRLGRNGRPFTIFKLRTMIHLSESTTGPRWSTANDPRITPIGNFLRRTHLDELPQLWNVLRLEMSLVGPRPERPEFVTQLERAIPRYRERLAVRPGVTGLAQVQLPPDTDLQSVREKLICDLRYIERIGVGLDLGIIFCTALGVLGIPHSASRKLFRVPTVDMFAEGSACRQTV